MTFNALLGNIGTKPPAYSSQPPANPTGPTFTAQPTPAPQRPPPWNPDGTPTALGPGQVMEPSFTGYQPPSSGFTSGYQTPRSQGYSAPSSEQPAWVSRGLDTLFNAMNAYGRSADFGGSQYSSNGADPLLWNQAGEFVENLDKFGLMPRGVSFNPTMAGFSPYQGMSPRMYGTAANAYGDSRGRENYYRDILQGFGYEFPEQAAPPEQPGPGANPAPSVSGLDVLLNALSAGGNPQQLPPVDQTMLPPSLPPVAQPDSTANNLLPSAGRFWENWR